MTRHTCIPALNAYLDAARADAVRAIAAYEAATRSAIAAIAARDAAEACPACKEGVSRDAFSPKPVNGGISQAMA